MSTEDAVLILAHELRHVDQWRRGFRLSPDDYRMNVTVAMQGLPISDFSRERMNATEEELRQEREAIAALL